MLYIKHKDEGCGIICHRAQVRNPIKSQTIDDVVYNIHKKKEKERQDRANGVYDTLLSKYKGLGEIDYNTARSMLLADLRNSLSTAVSSNIAQTSTTASERNAAISSVLSHFDAYCKKMSPVEAMYTALDLISKKDFEDITGVKFS